MADEKYGVFNFLENDFEGAYNLDLCVGNFYKKSASHHIDVQDKTMAFDLEEISKKEINEYPGVLGDHECFPDSEDHFFIGEQKYRFAMDGGVMRSDKGEPVKLEEGKKIIIPYGRIDGFGRSFSELSDRHIFETSYGYKAPKDWVSIIEDFFKE